MITRNIIKNVILVLGLLGLLTYASINAVACVEGCTNVREQFNFRSYSSDATHGWYTGYERGVHPLCDGIDIDHVVSLKEACELGLPKELWVEFANDSENHVPACSSINRSKGSTNPETWLERSQDGRGRDYEILHYEKYVDLYYYILDKYGLEKDRFLSNPAN